MHLQVHSLSVLHRANYVYLFLCVSSCCSFNVVALNPPTNMTILEIYSTSFTVSWRPPLGEKGQTLYYLVNVTDTEGERVVFLERKVNDITIPLQVEELLPGHVYQVSVAAAACRDRVGSSVTVFIRTSTLASTHTRALVCLVYVPAAWACFIDSRLNKLMLYT